MHVACVVELSHGCVDEGVACFAATPGFEEGEGVFPGYVCIFGFEGLVHAGRFLKKSDNFKAKLPFKKNIGYEGGWGDI